MMDSVLVDDMILQERSSICLNHNVNMFKSER